MEKVSNVHYVDGQELDEVERTIFATAYVAKLMRPNEARRLSRSERSTARRPVPRAPLCRLLHTRWFAFAST